VASSSGPKVSYKGAATTAAGIPETITAANKEFDFNTSFPLPVFIYLLVIATKMYYLYRSFKQKACRIKKTT